MVSRRDRDREKKYSEKKNNSEIKLMMNGRAIEKIYT